MKQVKNTVGGWMHYVEQVKLLISRDLVPKDYKELMQNYHNSVTIVKAAASLPLEAPVEPPVKKKN